MNQPKRILNKSRRKYSTSRLSSGSNGANEDGWYKTHLKAKAKKNKKATSLVDSDLDSLLSQSDDDDDKVVALGSKKMKIAGWKNDTNPKRYTTEDIDREIAMYKEEQSSCSSDDDNSS